MGHGAQREAKEDDEWVDEGTQGQHHHGMNHEHGHAQDKVNASTWACSRWSLWMWDWPQVFMIGDRGVAVRLQCSATPTWPCR